jgi:tetratricopeptide (TPR) repeat protein
MPQLANAVAALVVLLATACAAPPKPSGESLAKSRLGEAEARAAALARTGDYAGAATQYGQALRLASALENADSIAANAINLSVVQQWLGRDAEARAALSAVLDDPRTPFPERRRLQAELRRAILELAGNNVGAAAVWAGQAARRCPELSCEYAATILNVQAQVELESARPGEAERLALAAANRSGGNRAETANALRTLGRARHAQGQHRAALEPLTQALELDRELGDPRKILADLSELSRAADAAGDARAARDYRERSLVVSRAMNDGKSGPEMEALLRR